MIYSHDRVSEVVLTKQDLLREIADYFKYLPYKKGQMIGM